MGEAIATTELSEDGTKIYVYFGYDPVFKNAITKVPTARYLKSKKCWAIKADMHDARILRDAFGDRLKLDPTVKEWGKNWNSTARNLMTLANSDDAELALLPELMPELVDVVAGVEVRDRRGHIRKVITPGGRPYQRADIKFMAMNEAPGNCNQPGLGKTIEVIGAVGEAEMLDGQHLVIAPLTALRSVWYEELRSFQSHPVFVLGGLSQVARGNVLHQMFEMAKWDEPFWLVTNPELVRYVSEFQMCEYHAAVTEAWELEQAKPPRDRDKDIKKPKMAELRKCEARENPCEEVLKPFIPELFEVDWTTVVLDEFHKMGLTNLASLTSKAVNALQRQKPIAMSGTPMGGQPAKLYGLLHWLRPDLFSNKWEFYNKWLRVEEVHTKEGKYKKVEGVRPEVEGAFSEMLSQYIVRRTKSEVLSQLPPKLPIDVWAEMDGKQSEQYEKFAADAEIRIDEQLLSAASILSEYTRLRQFAIAVQTIIPTPTEDDPGHFDVYPTTDSCKFPHVLSILEELGISGNKEIADGDEQVVIFSQFTKVVDTLVEWLRAQGIACEKITGAVSAKRRDELIPAFQAGQIRVMVMNTTAGGTAITLDRASTCIFMDETWNPDDQEQASDRIHRGSRIHQVTVYYIRTKGTIEEFVYETTQEKGETNFRILDARRQGLRALREAS